MLSYYHLDTNMHDNLYVMLLVIDLYHFKKELTTLKYQKIKKDILLWTSQTVLL